MFVIKLKIFHLSYKIILAYFLKDTID